MAAAAVVGRGDDRQTVADESATIRTYDRVVRIASWVFLLAVTTIVGVTGLWPQSQTAIFLLLALGGVFVLVIHDLLPASALGPAKFVLEGSVAITVATVLVALTGGAASPFFFVYPLIVGGKPPHSWPAFMPVTFEMTILVASFTAVLGMLALNGLPQPYHPCFNVERFALATRDRFFLAVEAGDAKFDLAGTRELLASLGPRDVNEVPL